MLSAASGLKLLFLHHCHYKYAPEIDRVCSTVIGGRVWDKKGHFTHMVCN